jgi:hypothetical protein
LVEFINRDQDYNRALVTASCNGRAIAQTEQPWFEPSSNHVGFVVDKVALDQVFSEYFGFSCQFSFHRLLHTHHLPSGAGTISQLLADVPSGLSPHPKKLKKITSSCTTLRQCLKALPVPKIFFFLLSLHGLGPLPSFHSELVLILRILLYCRVSVGLLGRRISQSQSRCLHRTTQTRNKRRHRHPCLERDSNPRLSVLAGVDISFHRSRGYFHPPKIIF